MLRYASFALLLLSASQADATMVAYMADETLFDRATIVVQGVVWSRVSVESVIPAVQLEVEAVECFKGCKKGEWLAAFMPDKGVVGTPDLQPGDRVILYLQLRPHQGGARLVPISLGLSVYKLRYHSIMKRYLAERQIENLGVMLPARPGRDEESREITVARDRLAADFLIELRDLGSKRGTR